MKRIQLLILMIISLNTACSHYQMNPIHYDKNIKHVLFFSNEDDFKQEANYYDAVIELKKEYPLEMNNMSVLSPEEYKEYYDYYEIEGSPAIVVVYNNEILVKVNGIPSTDQIVASISQVLSKE